MLQLLEMSGARSFFVVGWSMGGPVAAALARSAQASGLHVLGAVFVEGNVDMGDCFLSAQAAEQAAPCHDQDPKLFAYHQSGRHHILLQ